jgi:hypothetical protein
MADKTNRPSVDQSFRELLPHILVDAVRNVLVVGAVLWIVTHLFGRWLAIATLVAGTFAFVASVFHVVFLGIVPAFIVHKAAVEDRREGGTFGELRWQDYTRDRPWA